MGGGRILYFIHRGSFYLLPIFKRKKERKKKVTKIHYVKALESTVRKQFRTEAPENPWFKEK